MRFTITKAALLRDFVSEIGLSRKLVKDIKAKGKILVNGNPETVRYHLQPGDNLELILPEEQCDIVPVTMALDVVYEDEHFLIVDKPANLACIPTKNHYEKSLANGVVAYYRENSITSTIHFVNRLDKMTQGLLLIAKDRYSHFLLSRDIKQVKRVYHSLVAGSLKEAHKIDLPIFDDGQTMTRTVDPRGKNASTFVRPLRAIGTDTLVECTLQTGRTHQIRVHLKALDHPLVNDELYNPGTGQMYLRSVKIEFIHPYTKELLSIEKINPQ